jgi:hypothetical protein
MRSIDLKLRWNNEGNGVEKGISGNGLIVRVPRNKRRNFRRSPLPGKENLLADPLPGA